VGPTDKLAVGKDMLYGGSGKDHIYGENGDDYLYGGMGSDTLYGGSGKDHIYGEDGDDHLYGGEKSDTLYGGSEKDHIYGEGGDDTIYGGLGSDRLFGGAGDDTIYFERDEPDVFNALFGGAGADKFVFETFDYGGGDLIDFSREEGDKIVFVNERSTQEKPSSKESQSQHSEEDGEQSDAGKVESTSQALEPEAAKNVLPAAFSDVQWTSHKDDNENPYVTIRIDTDTVITVHGIDHLTESDFLFA